MYNDVRLTYYALFISHFSLLGVKLHPVFGVGFTLSDVG